MITLSTSGNSIIFTFQDNQHYLQNGTIEVPKNSLLLVTDESNMATFKKSASNDIFISALYSELGMSKSELEAWFEENATTNYGGGGDITSGEVQTMIDESISGKADTSSLATVATTGDYDDLLNKPTIPTVPTSNTAFTNDAGYITEDALSGYAESSAVTAVNDVLTAHTANTTIHVTAGDKLTWDGKQDALTAGTGINIENDVISCTVTGGNNVVELTQAQYDALVDKDPDAFYIITDAPAIDLSGYAQTSAVTAEITAAVSGKVDTSSIVTAVTSASTDSEIPTAKAVFDAIPTGGTGASYSAGRGINIDTGNTISVSLPISAGTGTASIVEGSAGNKATSNQTHAEGFSTSATSQGAHSEGMYTKATQTAAHAEGNNTIASGYYSHAEGNNTIASGNYSHAEGNGTKANNRSEHSSGQYNVSSSVSTTFGDSGNTLFSVGNGTAENVRHNAFEIRQNGDIYISKDGQDVKLQDQLGGGASSAITSGDTNAVAGGAVYDKFDEVEQVTAAALNALNDNFGGLKLVKLTQQEYNDLAVKNNNTLYVII